MARKPTPEERAVANALTAGLKLGEQQAYERVLRAAASEVLGLEVADTLDFVAQAGVDGALPLLTEAARDVWPGRVRERMTPVLSAVMTAATEGKAPVLGSFTLQNPKMAAFLDSYTSELATNLSATSYDNAMRVIREAQDAGLSVDDAAARLRGRLSELNQSRSELISRNELLRSSKGASYLQATESGVVATKTRQSAGDSRVRPEHAAINGETVPVDQPYSNGEQYCGENSVQCRCSDIYNVDIEALRGRTA